MSDGRINEQILNWIKINSKDDKIIEDFLKDLIYEEAEHPGQWKWKDSYRKKINKYLDKWRECNEDYKNNIE
jgi:hypothetical protein